MNKSELKKALRPIIKECVREAIFENGVLSGLITEVVAGLTQGNLAISQSTQSMAPKTNKPRTPNPGISEARNQLNEVKASLQKATRMEGIFEGTDPLPSRSSGQASKYGALRDKDPSDAGVNIDGLMKMTGGWSHLK